MTTDDWWMTDETNTTNNNSWLLMTDDWWQTDDWRLMTTGDERLITDYSLSISLLTDFCFTIKLTASATSWPCYADANATCSCRRKNAPTWNYSPQVLNPPYSIPPNQNMCPCVCFALTWNYSPQVLNPPYFIYTLIIIYPYYLYPW